MVTVAEIYMILNWLFVIALVILFVDVWMRSDKDDRDGWRWRDDDY